MIVLLLAGCKASVRVVISLNASGSGDVAVSVVLDRQAAARIGDVQRSLVVADLQRSGWTADPLVTGADGSMTVGLRHRFSAPGEVSGIVAQLGPMQMNAAHHRHLVSSSEALRGTLDLRRGVDAFSDPALNRAVGGDSLAAVLQQLAQDGGTVPTVTAEVVADLPGRPSGVVGGGKVTGHTVTWLVPLGQTQDIGASATTTDGVAVAWLTGAGLSLVGLLVVLVRLRSLQARRRQRSHSRHAGVPPGRR